MARPTKAVATTSKHLTKAEKINRQEQETRLKGKADSIHPSNYLNEQQKKIFRYIVEELKPSKVLSNLDVFILETCAIAIDRLQFIETKINEQPELMLDKQFMVSKEKYTKDLYRCCNELSLSPQSRAKLGYINTQAAQDEVDPLLKALKRVK
jgi:P27 family predicted phage terminase small subunit